MRVHFQFIDAIPIYSDEAIMPFDIFDRNGGDLPVLEKHGVQEISSFSIFLEYNNR
jgi:hypothetical protein